MKRLKIVALAACMLALSMALCSCNYLDRLKQGRIERVDDSTVRVDGHTYTAVTEDLWKYGGLSGVKVFYMADDEVPLLLIESFGYGAPVTWDDKVISLDGNLYARDDMTAAEIAALKDTKLDRFYWDRDWGTWAPKVADERFCAMVRDIMSGTAHEGMPSESEESGCMGVEFSTSRSFQACDANGYYSWGEYVFSVYANGKVFLMDWNDFVYYAVPDKYIQAVEAFTHETEMTSPLYYETDMTPVPVR